MLECMVISIHGKLKFHYEMMEIKFKHIEHIHKA
jgi:hypothetical protein